VEGGPGLCPSHPAPSPSPPLELRGRGTRTAGTGHRWPKPCAGGLPAARTTGWVILAPPPGALPAQPALVGRIAPRPTPTLEEAATPAADCSRPMRSRRGSGGISFQSWIGLIGSAVSRAPGGRPQRTARLLLSNGQRCVGAGGICGGEIRQLCESGTTPSPTLLPDLPWWAGRLEEVARDLHHSLGATACNLRLHVEPAMPLHAHAMASLGKRGDWPGNAARVMGWSYGPR